MAIQHTITRACVKASGVPALQCAEIVTADFERNVSMEIPAAIASPPSGDNFPVSWSVERAKLQSVVFSATRPCTVYTNDPGTGSPQDTIPLVVTQLQGQVLCWTLQTDGIDRCPFSNDVTILYVDPPVGGDDLVFTVVAAVNN